MIDIRFLRENPDIVKQNIKNKFQDSKIGLVDEVIALDAQSRKVKGEADNLRASRNKNSKMIGALMAQGKKEEAEEMKKKVSEDAARLAEFLLGFPHDIKAGFSRLAVQSGYKADRAGFHKICRITDFLVQLGLFSIDSVFHAVI